MRSTGDDAVTVPFDHAWTEIAEGGFAFERVFSLQAPATSGNLCSVTEAGGASFALLSGTELGFYASLTGASGYTIADSDRTLDLDTWHHALATYDGATLSLYIDGELVDELPASGTLRTPTAPAGDKFGIGFEVGDVPVPPPAPEVVIDVDFADGAPVDRAQDAAVTEWGEPTYGTDAETGPPVFTTDGDDAASFAFVDQWGHLAQDFTWECVFKLDAPGSNQNLCSGTQTGGMSWHILPSGELTLAMRTTEYSGYQYVGGVTPEVGTWHHAAVSWDGTTATFYLDGEIVAQEAIGGTLTSPAGSAAEKIVIGGDTEPTGIGFWSPPASYAGMTIWSRALTADEVFQAGKDWGLLEDPAVEGSTPTIVSDHKKGFGPGVTITVEPGEWSAGAELAYQWFVDGEAVEGATGTEFKISGKHQGSTVTVEVTGTLDGHLPTTLSSDPIQI
ncbi:LamG domain-containing protein [Brevibacterium litoralis]|uniref:LamG domain-containing protein n=1 Tax=Brevibacterium litoralis TaxID=3138935 RepID=UPI0032EE2587